LSFKFCAPALVLDTFLLQHRRMQSESRLSLPELRTLEAQVCEQPAGPDGTVAFLKDGILAVIRSAIAAEAELERRR
jgi:hypothetical protein